MARANLYKSENFVTNTVKLGDKEHFDKKQIGVKELFTDYQPFYTINLLFFCQSRKCQIRLY